MVGRDVLEVKREEVWIVVRARGAVDWTSFRVGFEMAVFWEVRRVERGIGGP